MKPAILVLVTGLWTLVYQPVAIQPTFQGSEPAATIVDVHGLVRWRPNRQTDPAILDIARRSTLLAGESILCDEGAWITIDVYGRRLTLNHEVGWYPIPFVPSMSAPQWWRRHYGLRGGTQLHVDPLGKKRRPEI